MAEEGQKEKGQEEGKIIPQGLLWQFKINHVFHYRDRERMLEACIRELAASEKELLAWEAELVGYVSYCNFF